MSVITIDHIWMLAIALIVDALVGDPDYIWRRAPHPVVLIGRLIDRLDGAFNRVTWRPGFRRAAGALSLLAIVLAAGTIAAGIEYGLTFVPYGWIGTVLVAAVLLAGRSLYSHVNAVFSAFNDGGLAAARTAVSQIVGRDPSAMDEAAVCRAAIESTAENFSDGVVAPAFWFALFGLPGLAIYKAINTTDSMIGHKTARYEDFGWAAARVDDWINLPASRLAGALFALSAPVVGGTVSEALRVMRAEAPNHRSPNAGWPEAAAAAALGLALAGPRRYRGVLGHDPYINAAGRRLATPADIGRCLRLYLAAWALLIVVVAVAGSGVVALS